MKATASFNNDCCFLYVYRNKSKRKRRDEMKLTDEIEIIQEKNEGKDVNEFRNCLDCKKCLNLPENEKDILERIRKIGK